MGPQAQRECLARMRERHVVADRQHKGRLLDEAVAMTGRHRKSLIRAWRVGPRPPTRRRAGRPTRYGPAVVRALVAIWTAPGYPWSVRLKALLPTWLPWARRPLALAPATTAGLGAIRARQIDRVLAPHKRTLRRRQDGRTKPGTLLKHHIPLRTDRWTVTAPGLTEIDVVAHSGDRAAGEFGPTLNLTDIHTTWVESGALLGKSQVRVQETLDRLRAGLPFRLCGIDSDNGSEFINDHLRRYCHRAHIQFTRGRPYKKDDNAHIEQKNWTHVRTLMGYVRYDSEAAIAAMNAVYADLRLLQNLFLPSVKLMTKERVGARVRRRYDRPQTPLARVRACPQADAATVQALVARRARLDPFGLAQRIDEGLGRVYDLANHRVRVSARVDAATPCGRTERVHKGFGKSPRTPFSTAPTRILFHFVFGNRNYGATKRHRVTVTYGSTGPASSRVFRGGRPSASTRPPPGRCAELAEFSTSTEPRRTSVTPIPPRLSSRPRASRRNPLAHRPGSSSSSSSSSMTRSGRRAATPTSLRRTDRSPRRYR